MLGWLKYRTNTKDWCTKSLWKKSYMKCGVWKQMKIWSSHLLDNLSNCLMNLKNSELRSHTVESSSICWAHDFPWSYLHLISNTALHTTFLSNDIPLTGKHQPNKLTYAQLCEFVAQLVRALHRHRRGSNPVESAEFFRFMRQLLKLSSKCEDHIFIWLRVFLRNYRS